MSYAPTSYCTVALGKKNKNKKIESMSAANTTVKVGTQSNGLPISEAVNCTYPPTEGVA